MATSDFQIKLNYSGVGQLLKCAEMRDVLATYAKKISGGNEAEVYVAATRAVGEAKGDNANNAMLKRM